MRFIFVSTACSEKKYQEIFETRIKKMLDPTQKFLLQIMRGIAADESNRVVSVSVIPVSYSCFEKYYISSEKENEKGIEFIYPDFINGKYRRLSSTFVSVYKTITNFKYDDLQNTVLIADPLNPYISMAARLAAKKLGISDVAIITDLPLFATNMKNFSESSIRHFLRTNLEKASNWDARRYSGYILLTESMNKLVNERQRPYIVVEGTAIDFGEKNKDINKKESRVFLYAGGIYEKYGIKQLVDAFCEANLDGVELHLYGSGNYVDEVINVSQKFSNVKYCGCVLNTEMYNIETDADLLINPRFSNEKYTEYSFPSKTLEYLSSGTPVLSTRLKGIPQDYEPYLYWIDDESIEGMKGALCNIMKKSDKELQEMGRRGRDFAIEKKNNYIQGKRIKDFAKQLLDRE